MPIISFGDQWMSLRLEFSYLLNVHWELWLVVSIQHKASTLWFHIKWLSLLLYDWLEFCFNIVKVQLPNLLSLFSDLALRTLFISVVANILSPNSFWTILCVMTRVTKKFPYLGNWVDLTRQYNKLLCKCLDLTSILTKTLCKLLLIHALRFLCVHFRSHLWYAPRRSSASVCFSFLFVHFTFLFRCSCLGRER